MTTRSWSRRWVGLGISGVLVFGVVAAIGRSAGNASRAASPVVVHLTPVRVLNGQDVVVSLTNLTDTARQPNVRILGPDGEVMKRARPTVAPGKSALVSKIMDTDLVEYLTTPVRADVSFSAGGPSGWEIAMLVLHGEDGAHALLVPSPLRGKASKRSSSPLVRLVPEHALRVIVTNLGTATASYTVYEYGLGGGVVRQGTIEDVAPGDTRSKSFPGGDGAYVRGVMDAPGSRALVAWELYDVNTQGVIDVTFNREIAPS